jgi:hypothetical protein
MVAAAAPLCVREAASIRRLLDTHEDPPVGSFTELATVPRVKTPKLGLRTCHRHRAFCRALHARVRTWARAVQHVDDVAGTLATTAGRRTAAQTAGDLASTSAPAQHALDLVPVLESATASRQGGREGAPQARSRAFAVAPSEAEALALVLKKVNRPASQAALGNGPSTRNVLELLAG